MTGEPPLEPRDASPAPSEDAEGGGASRPQAPLPEPALVHDQLSGGWLPRLRSLARRATAQQGAARRRRQATSTNPSAATAHIDVPADASDTITPAPRLLAEAVTDVPSAQPDASTPPAPSAATMDDGSTTGWHFGRPDPPALDGAGMMPTVSSSATGQTETPAPEPPPATPATSPALLVETPQLGLFAAAPERPDAPAPTAEVTTAVPDDLDGAPPEDTPPEDAAPSGPFETERPTPIPEPMRPSVTALLTMLFARVNWPEQPRYWNSYLAVLTGVVTLSMLMFVLAEPSPRWILFVASIATIAGLDGVLRATWRVPFERGDDTVPSLFLPALYVFAAPLLIEHNASGNLVILWALLAGAGFAAIAVAEVLSVRTGSPLYPYARMVTTAGAYFTAFALLGVANVLHVGLLPAVVATGIITAMLAIELVREGEVDPRETAVFAAVAGLVVAQARWLLFFLPLDGYPAGLALVLVFFLVTGVLHSYVLRQLNSTTAASYGLVTAIGLVLLAVARAAGVA